MHLALIPAETPLPRLQFKREALCEEVLSPLTKDTVKMVDKSRDQGGFYSHYFMATKHTGGFTPFSTSADSTYTFLHVVKFPMDTLTFILQGLHKGW